MSEKNIYPHHMGSKGYVAKIPEWKKKIEEAVSTGNPNLVKDIEEKIVNWLLARLELTKTANLSTRRKELPQFKKRQYNSLKRKDWFSSSLTGRMTFFVELSATLNTLDAFVASLLRCREKLVFQMMLGATKSVIDTREILKMRLKRK
jgi:hypothetical protein